jgi:hypothetical protein
LEGVEGAVLAVELDCERDGHTVSG